MTKSKKRIFIIIIIIYVISFFGVVGFIIFDTTFQKPPYIQDEIKKIKKENISYIHIVNDWHEHLNTTFPKDSFSAVFPSLEEINLNHPIGFGELEVELINVSKINNLEINFANTGETEVVYIEVSIKHKFMESYNFFGSEELTKWALENKFIQ
jgi:flagellar basal body-associated protein FliL